MLEKSTIPSRLPLFIQFHLSRLFLTITILKSLFSRVLRLLRVLSIRQTLLLSPADLCIASGPSFNRYIEFHSSCTFGSVSARPFLDQQHRQHFTSLSTRRSPSLSPTLSSPVQRWSPGPSRFPWNDQCRPLDCLSRLKYHHLNLV